MKINNGKIIALSGNPNVGKSTVFNALTGMKQHTGNWTGKTVQNAIGTYSYKDEDFSLVDIPGTYSLLSCSADEEVARDFICFGEANVIIVVADATCLERNLNLVLQILEINKNVVLCVNLLDEAKKKRISIDFDELSLQLGIPVVGTSARAKKGLNELKKEVFELANGLTKTFTIKIKYDDKIENAIYTLTQSVERLVNGKLNSRWVSLRLLDYNESLVASIDKYLGVVLLDCEEIVMARENALELLRANEISSNELRDIVASKIVSHAEEISKKVVEFENFSYNKRDRKIDSFLTSKATGIPIMLFLLGIILWLTMVGASYPSELLSRMFNKIELFLNGVAENISAPLWLEGILIQGVFKTVSWVIAVMLPPMAIFFPLFTLLEDLGYLPRVAFNLDKFFRKANVHGKQSLSMCMGFGCNACGVVGCRIIDSPREKLIAILTNSFVPCNGRFPTLVAIITMFFVGVFTSEKLQSVFMAFILVCIIFFSVFITLKVSKLLSKTILKGLPSSFVLELPPYRTPQIGKVIINSIFNRTIFVLGRAVVVAIPAGIIIWLMANIAVGETNLLTKCSDFIDPFASFIGLDGVILLAFILGFPANEIVFPIIIMAYMSTGTMTNISDLGELRQLLIDNNWTWVTAICTILFTTMHFPCSTTCLTIKKETGSLKWTAVAIALPTVFGVVICGMVANIARVFV